MPRMKNEDHASDVPADIVLASLPDAAAVIQEQREHILRLERELREISEERDRAAEQLAVCRELRTYDRKEMGYLRERLKNR